MVNLGLIKDFKSCSAGVPRLCFCAPQGSDGKMTLLKSWLDQGIRVWELVIPRWSDEKPEQWIRRLSGVIKNLGQYTWCLSTRDLIQNLHLPLDQALKEWGRLFWPHFRQDSLFYFTAENQAQIIRQIFFHWQNNDTIICFREKYDLTMDQTPDIYPGKQDGSVRHFLNFKNFFGLLKQGKN